MVARPIGRRLDLSHSHIFGTSSWKRQIVDDPHTLLGRSFPGLHISTTSQATAKFDFNSGGRSLDAFAVISLFAVVLPLR